MKKILSYLLVIITVLFCLVSCDGNVSKKGSVTPYTPVVIPVEGLSLDITSKADLPKGDTFTITATVIPTSATNKTIKWTSSDTNIATVDNKGNVTGINPGTTYIVATTADGGFSQSCSVKVLDIFTVTFDSKGGSSVSLQKIVDGKTATTPTNNPTRATFGFIAWTTDLNAYTTSTKYDFGTPITTNTTLYAMWQPNAFNITYKDKGDTTFSGIHGLNHPLFHTYGSTTNLVNPSKTGYTFGGWSTQTDCATTITSLGATDYNSDITLYALWNANTYTVTFNVNGGDSTSPTSKTVTYGSAYGTLATATRTDYTFGGWYDAASNGNLITSSTTVSKALDHNLYAYWTENGKYTVLFNSNSATTGDVPTSITNYINVGFTVPDNTGNLAKTGYTFSGWNTEADGSGEDYTTGSNVTPTDSGTITLHAQWTANVYNITYKDKGDTAFTGTSWESTSPTSHTYGSTTNLVSPSKDFYLFDGWSTDSNCATTITSLGATDYTSNITLYAEWIPTKGTVVTSDTNRTECGWVQLWKGGPKWAEFNIGSTITSYSSATGSSDNEKYSTANVGGLYTWGGIQDARTSYTDDHCTSTTNIQGSACDTAKNIWGDNWQMPKKEDYDNLLLATKCTWTWCTGSSGSQYTTDCTLAGYKVSGKGEYANNSIFLPSAGYYDSSSPIKLGTEGYYWSSDHDYNNQRAYRLEIKNNTKHTDYYNKERKNGFSVRAILAE